MRHQTAPTSCHPAQHLPQARLHPIPAPPAPTHQLRLLLLPPQLAQLALGRHIHADGGVLRVLPHRPPPPCRRALLPLAVTPVLIQRQPAGAAPLLPVFGIVLLACCRRALPVRGQEVGQRAAAAAAAELSAQLLQRLLIPSKQLGLQLLNEHAGRGGAGVRGRAQAGRAKRGRASPPSGICLTAPRRTLSRSTSTLARCRLVARSSIWRRPAAASGGPAAAAGGSVAVPERDAMHARAIGALGGLAPSPCRLFMSLTGKQQTALIERH